MGSKPSIYAYLNYRTYLQDVWNYLKEARGFSNRTFAKEAGIKSPTHLFLVMSGKRTLTESLRRKVTKAFSLRNREAEFLKALVEFDEASSTLEQDEAYRKILSYKQFAEGRKLSEESHAYYSRWEHIALLEAIGTSLGAREPGELGALLGLSESETRSAISSLQSLGLIEKRGSRWVRLQTAFETPQETASLLVRSYHREMIKKALTSVDQLSTEERKLFSVTLPLDQAGMHKFSERIFEALREISSDAVNEKTPDGIYQVNLQLFPLMRVGPKSL
jgi:uncharacterized protein (TIGR02147 family)